jgi:hypothetical protein
LELIVFKNHLQNELFIEFKLLFRYFDIKRENVISRLNLLEILQILSLRANETTIDIYDGFFQRAKFNQISTENDLNSENEN